MLKIKNLHTYYGAIHALKGISLEVPRGKIVTLLGANGAGKSTTLKSITGLVKVKKGEIIFKGKDITNSATHRVIQDGIALIPEGRQIFPNLTVRENLLMGAYARDDEDGIQKDMEWVLELFPRLKERINQMGGTLSGGEQQMLAVGRGLMSHPELLMLDEPSLGLAPMLVKEIFEIIRQINSEGETILLIEQNAMAALKIADYGYILETGNIVLKGSAEALLHNEDVRKVYLGVGKVS
ncbi:MAG: ABC transporter ATP-binding protein [Thermotogae bacterium]|nr:ABC transporter ATP-binding protein [Thermotogota bacterium]